MSAWHQSRKADLALRLVGLILCGISYLAVSHLYQLRQAHPGEDPDAISVGLAAVGFLAGSSGGVLLILGSYLFDEVELPARYRRSKGLSETDSDW